MRLHLMPGAHSPVNREVVCCFHCCFGMGYAMNSVQPALLSQLPKTYNKPSAL